MVSVSVCGTPSPHCVHSYSVTVYTAISIVCTHVCVCADARKQ